MRKLSRREQRWLRRLGKRGRAGATARELGGDEGTGLMVGSRLVKLGLATVTRNNRFMLTEHFGTTVPAVIAWEPANPKADPRPPDKHERPLRQIGRIPSRNESVADLRGRQVLLGPPCPRCNEPTQVRKHAKIGSKQLRQPFYYARWYYCVNRKCRATLIMPPEFKVWNNDALASEPNPRTKLSNSS
jgi:hypothetical protein